MYTYLYINILVYNNNVQLHMRVTIHMLMLVTVGLIFKRHGLKKEERSCVPDRSPYVYDQVNENKPKEWLYSLVVFNCLFRVAQKIFIVMPTSSLIRRRSMKHQKSHINLSILLLWKCFFLHLCVKHFKSEVKHHCQTLHIIK